MWNEVYYRIYYYDKEDNITVVCMQDFDECDYIQDNFITDEDGDKLSFNTEDEAIDWLNENVRLDKIDPEYKKNKANWKDYLL